jgi:NitT/TauT family transport system substrate-binding protein
MPRIARLMLLALAMSIPPLAASAEELPTLKVGYVFTTHHTPLLVAASLGQPQGDSGVHLKAISPRERYELVVGGQPVAVLDLVVTKSGSETATLFAQKHLDLALASVTAIMAGVDKGTPIKVLAPLQTEGMALVAPKDSPLRGWDDFVAAAKTAKEPLKVGYHSPTSAPKIVLEGALQQAGLRVTQDPNDGQAQVLLADLKETTNMIPALASHQVDAVVGPSPFPEVAVTRGVGQILVDLRDLPPAGHWHDYPCCVLAATQEATTKHPQVVAAFVELMARTNHWCNQNRAEAGALAARWIGIPEEAGRASKLVFLTGFNQSWMRGTASYLELLNRMGNFKGRLKGKQWEEAKDLLLDSSFSERVRF